MRSYIGNITTNNEAKIETDPAREALRRALVRQYKVDMMQKDAKENSLKERTAYLFDENGLPPPNISLETILAKRDAMVAILKWIRVVLVEVNVKLQSYNPEQYALDQQEKEEAQKANSTKAAELYEKYYEPEYPDLHPQLQEDLLTLIQNKLVAFKLQQQSKKKCHKY